jgi:hypothetical protein
MRSLPSLVDEDSKVGSHARIHNPRIRRNPRNLLKGRLVREDARMWFLAREDDAVGAADAQRGETLADRRERILDLGELPGRREGR